MNRPCDKAIICDGPFDSDDAFAGGYASTEAPPAATRCIGIDCVGIDDPFSNYSSEFADDASFFADVFECACVDNGFFLTLKSPGFIGPWTWDVIGDVPIGLTVLPNFPTNGSITLNGGFSFQGHYDFRIRVTDGWGNVFEKHMVFNVLKILTDVLPPVAVGSPYSFQLVAVGGSGHYAWRIVSGGLPQGLSLSIAGKITGTPSADISQTVEFQVVDTTCTTISPVFLPARVQAVGRATTRIVQIIGFPEFVPSTPPKKYRRLDWSGFSSQQFEFDIFINPNRCPTVYGGITINYSGATILDNQGNTIQERDMFGDTACRSLPWVLPAGRCVNGARSVIGQGGVVDTTPCGAPGFTFWSGTVGGINSRDVRWSGFFFDTDGAVNTGTTRDVVSADTREFFYHPDQRVPGAFGLVPYVNDYHIVLSDEFTDADAYANAIPFQSTGLVAQNLPRITGYTSQFTDVEFDLNFSNLSEGMNYVASISFLTSDGTISVRNYAFTPSSDTHQITDTIPTPPAGRFTIALLPTVAYAP